LSNSFDENNAPIFKKQNIFHPKPNNMLSQSFFKDYCSIFKTDPNRKTDLLDQYSRANLRFRDEEFTQQAESFIMKIAMDKKIPKEWRAKFPLYQILIAICKIFMLNEYEIVAFSCTLDHCNWRIDEAINADESSCLTEFPANYGMEINEECKKFIMYLLVLAFSLKQYLNDKSEVDAIQTYCEGMCLNFPAIFNRWLRSSPIQKFKYSAPEINKKYKYLSKREYADQMTSLKDYNLLVDNIMSLTGSYNSKAKNDNQAPQPQLQSNKLFPSQQAQIFYDLPSQSLIDMKSRYPDDHLTMVLDKGFSKQMTLESIEDLSAEIPNNLLGNLNRQGSFSQLMTNFSNLKRQDSYEWVDKNIKKKVKWELGNTDGTADNKENLSFKTGDALGFISNFSSQNDGEDYYNLGIPILGRKVSNPDEMSSFSRYNSNIQFLFDR
jgi:hypothetical protein